MKTHNAAKMVEDETMPGLQILIVNNRPKMCPFQMPMMVQKKSSIATAAPPDPVIQYKACGTWCACFRVDEDDNGGFARLSCGSESRFSLSK